jgi:cation:H+ antiporter
MPNLELANTLLINIGILIVAAAFIVFAGKKMAKLADVIADKTGLGEAITGMVFLGLTTSLPGVSATVTLSLDNAASMMATNALGGIAVQTVFIAIADLSYRKANLEHSAASLPNVVQAGLLVVMMSIIILAFIGPDITIGHVNPLSITLPFVAIIGVHLTNKAKKDPMWYPKETQETVEDKPEFENKNINLSPALAKFFFAAVIVMISGVFAANSATNITNATGISQSLMGGVFLAIATSLPELVTTVAAVRAGALTLAVGDIVGGNFFDALFLAIGDGFYFPGSSYHAAGITNREPFLAAICIILNIVLLLGLLMRQKLGSAKVGVASGLLIFLYLSGLTTMYLYMS